MRNPYKEAKELGPFKWIWKNKKVQVVGVTAFGLIFMIPPLFHFDSNEPAGYILSGVGLLVTFLAGYFQPFLIYKGLEESYEKIEASSANKSIYTSDGVLSGSRVRTPPFCNRKRVILVGAAGSGKDYLRDRFEERGYMVDVSLTTRPMRDGEVEGSTYHYVSEKEFNTMKANGGFYEYVEFNTAQYGTAMESWNSFDIFIMTPSGIKHITEEDRKDCLIVYLCIDETIRRERMSKRSDNGFDKVERRIKADNEDFKNFELVADVIITNPFFDLDETIDQIIRS